MVRGVGVEEPNWDAGLPGYFVEKSSMYLIETFVDICCTARDGGVRQVA